MRVCPNCRAEVNDFDSICEYCGSSLPVNIEFESAFPFHKISFSTIDISVSH